MTTMSSVTIADEATVPVIDISAARDGAHPAAMAEVAEAVGRAGRSLGFLQVVGHGIDRLLFHRVYAAAEQLWALPDAVLDQWASPTGHPFRGVWYGLDDRGARVWQRQLGG